MTNGKGENDETGRRRTERKEEVSEATKEARGCCGRKVARAREKKGDGEKERREEEEGRGFETSSGRRTAAERTRDR